jgi:glycosyltransferase involved in cell wall biosynthesis
VKVAIVNNQAPFVRGGAELLAEWLQEKLEQYGHQAEIVRLPFQWTPAEKIVDHMLAARLVRLANVERVVALKFPAYYVPHENKVLWLLHQFRQAYDLWGTPYQDLPDTAHGHRIRDVIIEADRVHLPEARRIYTNSEIVGRRLRYFSGMSSEVLFPPLLDSAAYRCEQYGDYFFFPSRITAGKRQHVAAEAMAQVKSSARLVIAGQPESPEDLQRLLNVVHEHGLERRVEVIDRWISDEEKLALFAGARGVVYLPFGEDSYGYVTLEAFHARKPVLTMLDSGGTLELVQDGRNGRVCDGVAGLARAIDELAEDRSLAESLGRSGLETIEELQISWDRVIECLTG